MDFTIKCNTGGNHGHRIKDLLGGLVIGKLFNLNYVHTPSKYLDFFGVGYNREILKESSYKDIRYIGGPLMHGIDDFNKAKDYFSTLLPNTLGSQCLSGSDTLVIINKSLRIHPTQTIPWYKDGKLDYDIFSSVCKEISDGFCGLHSIEHKKHKLPITVAIHINNRHNQTARGHPQGHKSPRYKFPMDYYENIMTHIEKAYGVLNIQHKIYTEKGNSEEIVERFGNRKNTEILLGSNREAKNYDLIHNIFRAFIESDILVCSNSAFSVVCAYFRKGKPTIYHPHSHLDHLEGPEHIPTNSFGDFNISLLGKVDG